MKTATKEIPINLGTPDNSKIRFAVRSKPVRYGDDAVLYEYTIIMRIDGKAVGVECGPRRTHPDRRSARSAGYERIRELKKCPLYAIPVTAKDIQDGEARSCNFCAIALAIYHQQKRMGIPEHEFDFRVEPYGAFTHVDGIVLAAHFYPYPRITSSTHRMPDLIGEGPNGLFITSMYEWAVHWDDYADSRSMTAAEWNEEHPDDGGKPHKPSLSSFVLNLADLR